MGKNKLARWTELATFNNVIQCDIREVSDKDHAIKGKWNQEAFRNNNPIILELGCGKGEYTVSMAKMFPSNNFIGIDIKGARMWRGAKTSNELGLPNVFFLRTRIEFITSFFATDEVDEIWITFPDPHPGGTNFNKRLTSPMFLNSYMQFMKNDGLVHLKTDNLELFEYTKSVINKNHLKVGHMTNDLYSENSIDNKITEVENSPLHGKKITADNFGQILSIKTYYEQMFLSKRLKINFISFKLNKNKAVQDV